MRKLNLGCGGDIRQDFINCDVRKLQGIQLRCDIEHNHLPFKDSVFDEVLAKDVIEHVSFRRVETLLKEIHRILKVKGKVIIQTPDFEQIVRKWQEGKIKGWWQISYWLYGAQDYPENTHKLIFTKSELKNLLEQIGFEVFSIENDNTNFICEAIKK